MLRSKSKSTKGGKQKNHIGSQHNVASGKKLVKRTALVVACCLVVYVVILFLITKHSADLIHINANEAATIANLHKLYSAQNSFRQSVWYTGMGDRSFANGAKPLYSIAPDHQPELISRALSEAFGQNAAQMVSPDKTGKKPLAGYVFIDISHNPRGAFVDLKDLTAKDLPIVFFNFCAIPAEYGKTGKRTFIMDVFGTIYATDSGGRPATVLPLNWTS